MLARRSGWALFAWAFNGLQIWLLVPVHSGMSPPLSVGGYAFAWSVGFLVVLAPGGLGVREVVLVTTLTPLVGVGTATAVALVSRAVTTASDLICAGVSAAIPRNPALPVIPAGAPASGAQHDGQGPLQHESLMTTDMKQSGRELARYEPDGRAQGLGAAGFPVGCAVPW